MKVRAASEIKIKRGIIGRLNARKYTNFAKEDHTAGGSFFFSFFKGVARNTVLGDRCSLTGVARDPLGVRNVTFTDTGIWKIQGGSKRD